VPHRDSSRCKAGGVTVSPARRILPALANLRSSSETSPAHRLRLCTLTLLAFSNSFDAGFTWDNRFLILQDPRIRDLTPQNIDLIIHHTYWWPTGESGLYRPLTTLSYLFNYSVLDLRDQPLGYHWLNFILHAMNVLLVYALTLRIARRFWPAVFIAAIWGVHPASTESVTNIIGRADLLAAMATFSGFLMYLKSRDAVGVAEVRLACRVDVGYRRRSFLEGKRCGDHRFDCDLRACILGQERPEHFSWVASQCSHRLP